MLKNSIIFIIMTVLLFAGCTNLQKEPPVKQYFDLNVTISLSDNTIDAANLADVGKALLVKELLIAPTYDSHAFVYRMGNNTYQTDFYNEFISYPAQLITDKATEILCGSNYFSQPLTHRKKAIAYRLSGKITHLYGDFRKTGSPKAVMEIRLNFEKKEGQTFLHHSSNTYRMDEPIASTLPEDLVVGWNKGLEKIIIQFLKDYK